jgi:hypothetical protein
MRRWVEIEEDGRTVYRFMDDGPPPQRSDLPFPSIISDEMDPVEQVDGRFYTSKRRFRAVGREHGLIEVGNEKLQPKTRASADPSFRSKRKRVIKDAIEKTRAGHYERYIHDAAGRRAAAASRSDDT